MCVRTQRIDFVIAHLSRIVQNIVWFNSQPSNFMHAKMTWQLAKSFQTEFNQAKAKSNAVNSGIEIFRFENWQLCASKIGLKLFRLPSQYVIIYARNVSTAPSNSFERFLFSI